MADDCFNTCERVHCIFGAMFQGCDYGVSYLPVGMCPVVEQDSAKNKYVTGEGQEYISFTMIFKKLYPVQRINLDYSLI